MKMENDKEIEKLFSDMMCLDELDIQEPELSLVEHARKKVQLRKKQPQKQRSNFFDFTAVFTSRLKFYQVGFSVMVTGICLVYSLEINENSKNGNDLGHYSTLMMASNNSTVSVNSSTLLTSIPTLVIRN